MVELIQVSVSRTGMTQGTQLGSQNVLREISVWLTCFPKVNQFVGLDMIARNGSC